MAEVIRSITGLPVTDITMLNRLRPVSPAGVAAIRASIEELGVMQDPIHVRKVKHRGGQYTLMVGAHRLTAAIEMGWETIPVTCWACNDDFAKLMELDDNLAGAELTALDTAVFLAERKRVYEKIHPETKRGIAGAEARHSATDMMSVATFASVTAEKFGLTDRHIRRLVATGEKLEPNEIIALRKAERPVSLNDLIEIGRIQDSDERASVVLSLSHGNEKNCDAARKAWAVEMGTAPKPADPNEKAFRALCTAWSRAPKRVRAQFLQSHSDQIQEELTAVLEVLGASDD